MVEAKRQLGEEATITRRYFISSLDSAAEQLLHAVRTHWGIENKVHWVLDIAPPVTFYMKEGLSQRIAQPK